MKNLYHYWEYLNQKGLSEQQINREIEKVRKQQQQQQK